MAKLGSMERAEAEAIFEQGRGMVVGGSCRFVGAGQCCVTEIARQRRLTTCLQA